MARDIASGMGGRDILELTEFDTSLYEPAV